MDIAVVHNFAEHPGGGDLVALDIVESLLENGHTIYLYTSMPEGIERAVEYFDKDLRTLKNLVIKRIDVPRYTKHPYDIYFITKRSFNKLKKYDIVVFFDDIPRLAHELKRVLVYVHYPHASRILLNQLVPYSCKYTLKGRLIWKVHRIFFKSFFLTNWNKLNIYVVVNSTLTYQHVSKALKPMHLVKIYPPVQVEQIIEFAKKVYGDKEDTAVYVGRIQPDKGVEDIVKAVARLRNVDIKVKILGFYSGNNYLKHLERLVRELGVVERVEITVNASRRVILEALAKAKVLIHPAYYEPFGIAVVEGMAAGCIPIVRKGFNGPWVDIIKEGKYGHGFNNAYELAKILSDAFTKESINIDPKLLEVRSLELSEGRFKERILQFLKSLV